MRAIQRIALIATAVVLYLLLAPPAPAQQFKPDQLLKPDPVITIGKLENGLTYYIRANKRPEKRAELRLVVKAGSVLEDDDQQGLAHFVEHMAFNGTKSFPKQELVNFLERTGVRFGPDLNAYTSFDETVYMLQVPTDSPHVVQKAFKILEEWAHAVSFDPEEIDKERGVVIEEWRLRKGAFDRIQDKHNPVIFHNSRYADRLPVGKKEILESFEHDVLRRFYRDWYRPGLMAVVAVGDFDKGEIEKMIRERFTKLKNPTPVRTRDRYGLPDHAETLVSIATDAELPFTSVGIIFKRELEEEKTVSDYRRSILYGLYDEMLNARLQEIIQKPNAPFAFASTFDGRFYGGRQTYQLFAGVKEDAILRGLEALLAEAFRVQQHGFTATELERGKKERMRFFERALSEREKTESRRFADEYIRNFLRDEPIPGIEIEHALNKELLPGITLEEVNAQAAVKITPKNRIVTVSAPQKEGVVVPTEEEVLTIFNAVSARALEPYVDRAAAKPLMAAMPTPGRVVEEKTIPDLGVTEWRLSNGARVVLKPTDFKNDEVLFSAFSRGGTSLVSDDEFTSAQQAAGIVAQSGVGEFDAIELQKMLAGKVVRVSPTVSELSEGFSGNASPQDLETLFQIAHLYFTSPRKDTGAFSAYRSRLRAFLDNRSASPESAFQDTFQVTMAQYHRRARPFTAERLDEIDLGRAYSFYRDRFADAGDFIFFFVGNFRLESIKPLVELYLASLPSLGRKESWRDVGMRPPRGVIKKEVIRGIEPKSLVQMGFSGDFDWSDQSRFDFNAMLEVLRIKLREVLREDKGGVYGVQLFGSPSLFPRKEYRVNILFGCSPDRVEELVGDVMEQIDSLKIAVDDSYIVKVKELLRRGREVSLKENGFWMSHLRAAYANEEDPRSLLDFPKMVEGLTSAAVRRAARKYLDPTNVVKVALYPEKK